MIFQVDFQAGKPVYLQLADQIRYAAASCRLRQGVPLPSLRPLAEELRINRNTIAQAYAELEAQGIIETIPGKGFFLKKTNSHFTPEVRERLLLTEIDEAVIAADHLQVPRDQLLNLVKDRLEFLASFRQRWNRQMETDLMNRFQLDPAQKASHLSKGQKTQLALIAAVCPEPDLLVLDEPTSGLDPIVRREFIQTVIGAYHAADPEHRTVFVSTHLIAEFEGLIDEFTIIERGRELLTMEADDARNRFQKIRACFPQPPSGLDLAGALSVRQSGRELELLADGNRKQLV